MATNEAQMNVRELVPGVYALETLFWGKKLNLYLFKGKRALLADAGVAGMPTDLIQPRLDEVLGQDTPPSFLVNAHSHIDHFGGNAEFRERYPHLVILAHAKEVEYISNHNAQYAIIYDRWPELFQFEDTFRQECIDLSGADVGPDLGLQGDETIELGGLTLRVVNLPGHSFGDIGLYDAAHNLLFSGESLLGEGARDESGAVVAPPYYENAADYYTSIRTVQDLEPEILCTSHCGVLEGAGVPAHVAECMEFFINYERGILSVLKDAGAEGLNAEQAARQFAEKCSPFEFRLETMQLVSTHLEFLAKKGQVKRKGDRFCAA